MSVQSLHLFPIKSIHGVRVDQATCGARGFEGDRRYMIVNPDGRSLTQRTVPELGLIRWLDDHLLADGHTPIAVPEPIEVTRHVQVWSAHVDAYGMPDPIDAWISNVIGQPAHLVFMDQKHSRPIDAEIFGDAEVSFADGFPYLITNTASLADLNARIAGPEVLMDAFRANIVIDTSEAWAEDEWKRLRIGGAEFEIVSPCERCKVTTLDPEDPRVVRRDGEPLRTLATFRRSGGGVIFGVNAICRTPGVAVQIGDACTVTAS
ncbi:MAG: MOSC domain-containing protein [bacterium]